MANALTAREIALLLERLCVELGFCLPPDDARRIVEAPPEDVRGFVDAVFRAEGLDPSTTGRHLYRQVRDVVAAAFGADADSEP